MKIPRISPRLLLFALLLGAPRLHAALTPGQVAVLAIRMPGEKQTKRVIIEFYEQDAPLTVENFEDLARHHFFDGMTFHRVFKDMLVQTGDPLSKRKDKTKIGTGGPGYTLPPEIRLHAKHIAGAVAMSRLGDELNPSRRSSGSQFYIPLVPMPNLDGQYTVFGHVIEGMDVLHAVSQAPVDTNDNPLDRIIIKSVTIHPRG